MICHIIARLNGLFGSESRDIVLATDVLDIVIVGDEVPGLHLANLVAIGAVACKRTYKARGCDRLNK